MLIVHTEASIIHRSTFFRGIAEMIIEKVPEISCGAVLL